MNNEVQGRILDELFKYLPMMAPWLCVTILLVLFLVSSIIGVLLWPSVIGLFKKRKNMPLAMPDRSEAIILCGIIARDLAYGLHKQQCDDVGRIFRLARQAMLAGISRFLGKKGTSSVRICILVPKEDCLVIEEADGYSAEARTEMALAIKETVAGESYERLETRYCEDRLKDPGYKEHPKRKRDYRSIICIPITAGYGIYGVLNVDAIPPKAFTQSEIQAMEAFAKLLALSYTIERGQINGMPKDSQATS